MNNLANVLTALVLLEHVYIVWMEMFAWETAGKRSFGKALPAELFKPTKGLAANQGLYNGFLVGGLAWSFFINDPVWSGNVRLFFLGCVLVAGVFGGITASKKIFFIQGVPAFLAILSMIFLK
jgi:putative membrane protein